jgi:outer membrane protein OmpA-like peptidoglycan-associated protein
MQNARFLSRTILASAALTMLPLSAAWAQTGPRVRVVANDTIIQTFQYAEDDVLKTAGVGEVFEVIHTDGDKYRHHIKNWYWVLLPRDEWGTQRAGWVSGRYVEQLAPVTPVKTEIADHNAVIIHPPATEAPPPPPVIEAPIAPEPPARIDVTLLFEFAKSHLTDDAKGKLAEAMSAVKDQASSVTFSLAGHTDSVGNERYNEKLGLARAETVKRYLAEQYQVPGDQISIETHGEAQPVVSNTTAEGRAQNRRVVIQSLPKNEKK